MIQRIQTLYILIAAVLTILLFSIPAATIIAGKGLLLEFSLSGVKGGQPDGQITAGSFWPLWVLAGLILFLLLWSVFLFRRRNTQMRIVIYAAILQAGLLGMMLYYIQYTSTLAGAEERSFEISLVFPVVSIILLILAVRGIRKDELLATAYQRLR